MDVAANQVPKTAEGTRCKVGSYASGLKSPFFCETGRPLCSCVLFLSLGVGRESAPGLVIAAASLLVFLGEGNCGLRFCAFRG
jgi:hypothetical protein